MLWPLMRQEIFWPSATCLVSCIYGICKNPANCRVDFTNTKGRPDRWLSLRMGELLHLAVTTVLSISLPCAQVSENRIWPLMMFAPGRSPSARMDGSWQALAMTQPSNYGIPDDLTQPPIIIRGHEGIVRMVAFSPDGQSLASAGDDRTIRIWTVGLGALQQKACQRLVRNLAKEEWRRLIGSQPYHPTCPLLKNKEDITTMETRIGYVALLILSFVLMTILLAACGSATARQRHRLHAAPSAPALPRPRQRSIGR